MFLNSLWKSAGRSRAAVPANISRKASRKRPRARSLRCEALEDRRLLAFADFELSTLLPANGGDGSNGFVVTGITDQGKLGYPLSPSQPLGDVNQDGIGDFFLAATQTNGGTAASQAYIIFGRPGGGFPAELDLTTLNGANGYVIDGVSPSLGAGNFGGGAGDVNHDGIQDIVISAAGQTADGNALRGGRTFVLYGGSGNLAALDAADGAADDGRIGLSTFDAPAADGTHGFVINGYEIPLAQKGAGLVSAAGDVNGDGVDDLLISSYVQVQGQEVYVVYGRDSTLGDTFPAAFELSSLLPANGGDGSEGFVIWPLSTSGPLFGWSAGGAGDINHDGIGDLFIGDGSASPSGRTNAGQVHVIFGKTSFAATFDLGSLNGNNGFTVNGKTAGDNLGWPAGRAGDVNGDGVDDLLMSATYQSGPAGTYVGGAYVLFGKSGALPATLEVSALNGSNGFVIHGAAAGDFTKSPSAAGDVNGDGYDDMILSSGWADPNGITNAGQSYIVYGRPSFGASVELAGLLAANGGDGSAGYALNGFVASSTLRSIFVDGIGDINGDGLDDVRIGYVDMDSNGLTDNGQVYIVYGKPSPAVTTKFYVVNDASQDRTYEYNVSGMSVESYGLNSGNTAPRGAASTTAGTKTWVLDANRKVYVYNTSGGLLGSWTAGTLASNATVEGIATNGTDVWIVDAKSDKVYKYTGAATRTSGSQNAASSFSLNSGNTSPKDITTDGVNFWVVNDSTTDKVFKYTLSGSLVGSWTISTVGAASPTGITIDASNVSNIWIVDKGTKLVYQYNAAASRTSGSQAAAVSFALAAGNTNPQGIADPPAPGTMLATQPRASSASATQAMDAAIVSLMGGQTKTASTETTSTVARKTTVDWSFASPSPRTNTAVSPAVAATKSPISTAARHGPAARAVDHAVTALAGDDLKIESALQSLAGSRA